MDLLKSLIVLSQKAANIARVCRKDEHLFDLLVQKKKNEEANPRFVQDFKTLADVLIQEMVKHDVIVKFPELSDSIRGEESNIFRNKLGETICVEVKATQDETSALLEQVLNGDKHAAELLAFEVHKDIEIDTIRTITPQGDFEIDLCNLGVWIDPIDCTAEYIHGNFGKIDHNIDINGLKCVTVLIGVYNKTSGLPVMGVINRPFVDERNSLECLWGVSLPNYSKSVIDDSTKRTNVICISSSENDEIKTKLKEAGFHLVEAAGAGFKILTVILGFADAYIITKGTTFKWDTCAPHSILESRGGGVVDYKNTMENRQTPIVYSCVNSNCNSNGVIAFKNEEILNEIIEILR